MDNISIEFNDGKYLYKFKTLNNFDNILIERSNKINDEKYDLIQIMMNNGNLVFCSNIVEHYIKKMYFKSEKEQQQIIKKALMSLISSMGFNNITATIINKLGYDVAYLAKKLKDKKKLYDEEEYSITETKIDNEVVLNILDYNCLYVAKIYFKRDGIKIEKISNNNINIFHIVNKYMENNKKTYKKIYQKPDLEIK